MGVLGVMGSHGYDRTMDGSLYADLDDNDVIERAREIYSAFQRVPRWSAGNDRLLKEWGAICGEMGRRGITDVVTEGSAPGTTVFGRFSAE